MGLFDQWCSTWGRRLGLPVSALVATLLGLAATLVFCLRLTEQAETRAAEGVAEAGHSLVTALEVALAEIEGQSVALASLYSVQEEVTAAEFDTFARGLSRIPGTIGIGYAVAVPSGSLPAFAAQAAETRPRFALSFVDADGTLEAVGDTHEHMVILDFWAADRGTLWEGLCLHDGGPEEATIEAALSTDGLVLTPFLQLPGEADSDGVIAYRRVWGRNASQAAVLAVPIDLGETLAARGFGGRWRWRITDTRTAAVIGPGVADSDPAPYTESIYVADRVWKVEVVPGGRAAASASFYDNWPLLGLGSLASLIAGTAVWLTGSRLRGRREEDRLRAGIAAKDRFLASVSHELRTPLAGVVGFLETMPDIENLTAEQREHLVTAREQSWELTGIVEDLITANRVDGDLLKAPPEEIDLGKEAGHLISGLGRDIRQGVAGISGEAAAWAHPGRVRQILRNLLDNAAKHGAPPFRIRILRTDDRVSIQVIDHGPGLASDQVPRLFSPYESMHGTPSQPDNIGLGLWLSRRLARVMGGDLTYRREGDLTVFELTLPGTGTAPEGTPHRHPGRPPGRVRRLPGPALPIPEEDSPSMEGDLPVPAADPVAAPV